MKYLQILIAIIFFATPSFAEDIKKPKYNDFTITVMYRDGNIIGSYIIDINLIVYDEESNKWIKLNKPKIYDRMNLEFYGFIQRNITLDEILLRSKKIINELYGSNMFDSHKVELVIGDKNTGFNNAASKTVNPMPGHKTSR